MLRRAGGARGSLGQGVLMSDRILILDYGSQYTQLIARRIREKRVYCEIHPPDRSADWIRAWGASGVVLSCGPDSVND